MKGKGEKPTPKPPWEHLYATSEVNSWHRGRLDWKTEFIKYLGCFRTADKSTQWLSRDLQLVAVSHQSVLEEIFNSLSIILLLDHIFSCDPRSRSTPLTTGVNIGIRTGEGAWLQGDLLMKYNVLNEQLFLLPFLLTQAFPSPTIPSASLKSHNSNEVLNSFKRFWTWKM